MDIKNILITDDHALMVDGIIATLKEKINIGHIQVCYSPEEAIEAVSKQTYDLYILDLGFRTSSNIDIRCFNYIKQIATQDAAAKIIVYTMREDFAVVSILSKMKQVKGIVLKGPEKRYLQEAAGTVLEGGTYLCPRFRDIHQRSDEYRKRLERRKIVNGALTEKEISIIKLLAAGLNSEQIAQKLGHTTSTIESYRRDLKLKLNVSNTLDMVITTILLNHITLDDVAINLLKD
ncbi:response regulator transcription factor [Bacteroides sp. 519]|uniref:LuxR C-terminal-related transcriptional regulator n=1 Tax=Bacteroides sp. 519 TaxID=2302937 RepID=UPI0013D21FC3|nr:response regulator transcription factor [Bacteroides sp. 519]NDV58884.1 DNA-binding response regulator [Bacteroides sp. 519]